MESRFRYEDNLRNFMHCSLMTLTRVNSSSLRAVGYDGSTLYVQFHTSAIIYTHHGVPEWVVAGLLEAASMGAYYNRNIRGRYQ
jgi:hypothetical protein